MFVNEHKVPLAVGAFSLLLPTYLWFKCFKTGISYFKNTSANEDFLKKHNCVVMFHKEKGMSGWPAYNEPVPLNLHTYLKFLEPLQYFIQTAEKSLDIAVMIVSHELLLNALKEAAARDVKIRIITDKDFVNHDQLTKIRESGVDVQTDIKFFGVESIMHNKFAIKDYDASDGSGYTVSGSVNWVKNSFINNYEDLVFTSNLCVVGALHRNFEEMWEFFSKSKETHLSNDIVFNL